MHGFALQGPKETHGEYLVMIEQLHFKSNANSMTQNAEMFLLPTTA